MIEILIGLVLAIGLVFLARLTGSFEREKRIYAIGLLFAAMVYVGFGLFSGSTAWQVIEILGVPIYGLFAWLGLKKSGWFLAIGWALHVAWDALLHDSSTPFVPSWYMGFCIGFDLFVAGYIGFREFGKPIGEPNA